MTRYPLVGRWIITSTCHSDCSLVSASADPMGSWGGVYLSFLEGRGTYRLPGLPSIKGDATDFFCGFRTADMRVEKTVTLRGRRARPSASPRPGARPAPYRPACA